MMTSFNSEFPLLKQCTYLNTANSGLLSKSLMDWRRTQDIAFFEQGSSFRLNQTAQLAEVKTALARYFNADLNYTFLVPNFSNGFNIFLDGLDASQRFLLLENDYPLVNYAVASKGFHCDYLTIDENLEERIMEKIALYRPTVFAFSLVQYQSGIKLDLSFLKYLKASYPEMLIVADGTQFCGTEVFDFKRSGIDVLIASGYKWMLAGYGNGFLFLKEDIAQQLFLKARRICLPKESFLAHKDILSLSFEAGHQDTINFGALKKGVEYLEMLGPQQIAEKIKQLAIKAKSEFTSRGLLDPAVTGRKDHSPIFNLNVGEDVIERIKTANIVFSSRGKGIRVSFHFYNTESELELLLQIIDKR